MKICTICNQTYSNDDINYCLADGGLLKQLNDEPPPTVMVNQARKTNEIKWGNPPETNWGNNQSNWSNQPPPGPMQPWQNNQQSPQNQGYMPPPNFQSQNQTLPIVSMVLGILSITMCCYGIPFGIAAAITGYIGMNNANNNPMIYGGRGFAIAGLVMGVINILITIGIFIFFLVAGMAN